MKLSLPCKILEAQYGYDKAFEKIKQAGFGAVDYDLGGMAQGSDAIDHDGWMVRTRAVRESADRCGLAIDQIRVPKAPFVMQQHGERSYSRLMFSVWALELGKILGAGVAVVAPLYRALDPMENSIVFKKNLEYYRMLIPYAKAYGIKLGIESFSEEEIRTRGFMQKSDSVLPKAKRRTEIQTSEDAFLQEMPEFLRYVDMLDSEYVGVCLDLTHVDMSAYGLTQSKLIRDLGQERLLAVHLHDMEYRIGSRLYPYGGRLNPIEIARALGEVGFHGDIIFELIGYDTSVRDQLLPFSMQTMAKKGNRMIETIERYRQKPHAGRPKP